MSLVYAGANVLILNSQFSILNYVTSFHDFCRERLRVGELCSGISAKQVNLMALTAPKSLNYILSLHSETN